MQFLLKVLWGLGFVAASLGVMLGLSALAFATQFDGNVFLASALFFGFLLGFLVLWLTARRLFRDTWPY
jgi:hypothetical protein